MELRPLGRTGIKVPAICLGTMTWGQQNTEADGHAQMDYAFDRGVTFFDTAEMYSIPPRAETQGSTERIIGSWLKSRGRRDKLFLASKVVGRSTNIWVRNPPQPTRATRAQMMQAIDASLKRLQTDWIDLYQLHYPDRPVFWGSNPSRFDPQDFARADDETSFAEQLATLEDIRKAGKIRFFGLSNESAYGTMRFLFEHEKSGGPRVQTVQNAYNLINRTYETAMAELWLREDVGLLAYSPLAQGYITGKYLDGAKPPGARSTLFNRGQRYEKPGAEEAIRDYVALARELNIDSAALSLAFVTSRPFTTSTIIGATTMEHLRIALSSVDVKITPEIAARIDAIHQLRGNPAP